ncbi:MAG TPA: hypothetical protein PKW15_06885, partial [Alphaproteobacteria bacterium]|nr:hypothetical protein [Alphaproteobacteria bacterium]
IFENKCFPDPAYQKKIETFLDFMHGDSPLAQLCYKFFELLSELSIQDWKFRVQNRVHEKAAIDNHLDIAGVYAVLFDCIFSDRLIPAGDKLTVEEVRAANPAAFKIGVLGQKIDDMWDMVEDVLLDAGRDILVANSFLVRISSSDREEILDKFRGGDQTSRQIRFSDLPANVRKQAMDFCAEISAEAKELAFIPRSGMNFSVRATRWRDFGVIQSPQLI